MVLIDIDPVAAMVTEEDITGLASDLQDQLRLTFPKALVQVVRVNDEVFTDKGLTSNITVSDG